MTLPQEERCKLQCYNSQEVYKVWPIYKPLIEKALERGSNYTIDEILQGLCGSAMQLWTWGDDAALVTTIQNDGDKRWCLLLALGGSKIEEWSVYLPWVEKWARSKDCDELRIYGRPGWKKLGFDIEYTKLVRKL